jgi:hypothetical protein
VVPHIERAFVYEKHAIDAASSGFRALSYLNGGGLVTIPTAVALFNADPKHARTLLVSAGLCFVAGLVAVLIAQACLFFTMARRSEGQNAIAAYQGTRTSVTFEPYPNGTRQSMLNDANEQETLSRLKTKR